MYGKEEKNTMISLQGVTKTYAKNNTKAVDNLTLNVEGGELFGFPTLPVTQQK